MTDCDASPVTRRERAEWSAAIARLTARVADLEAREQRVRESIQSGDDEPLLFVSTRAVRAALDGSD